MKAAVLLPRLRSVALAVVALAALACSAAPGAKKDPLDPGFGGGDNEKPLDPPRNPDTVNDDGGAFDLGGRMSDGMGEAGRPPETDAGPSSPDSGKPSNLCQGSVGAGDFKVVEIMIASIAGSSDKGEWIGTVEAQRLLGMHSVNTVKAWAKRGWLRSKELPNGRVKVSLEDVLRRREDDEALSLFGLDREMTEEEYEMSKHPAPPEIEAIVQELVEMTRQSNAARGNPVSE